MKKDKKKRPVIKSVRMDTGFTKSKSSVSKDMMEKFTELRDLGVKFVKKKVKK